MASVRPETNNTHSLGTASFKWSALHVVDVNTATVTTTGDVEIGGNLTVLGTATTIDVNNLAVEDPIISLARNNDADSLDIGFYGKIVDGGVDKYVGLYRDATDGKFKFFEGLTTEPSTTVGEGGSTATIVANIEGAITGNSETADALSTARTISLSGDVAGSVSFDGSADVDITATVQPSSIENSMLANDSITVGDGVTTEAIALGQALSFEGTLEEVEVAYDAASNTFTFGLPDSITASLNGNASTASTLETARTISISGDATGSVSFNGSQNVDIALTIEAGAVENSMLANDSITFSDGTASDVTALGESLNIVGTANEVEVALDAGSSTFTVGLPDTIVADLTGTASDASQATKLTNARTLALSGDVAGSASFNGTANATIDAVIQPGAVENSMLANASITVGDGTTSEAISLGEAFSIVGTANETEVAYSAASNSFTVGLPNTITADVSGNASTADAWSTARTISISGAASGSASVDGSANADISITIAGGSIANDKLTNSSITFSDGTASDVTALGESLNIVGTANEVDVALDAGSSTFTVSLPATISADLNGNAATASEAEILSTARTLSISGDAAGSVSFNGSADADIALTIQPSAVENSMLANSSITFGDGTETEAISLGQALSLVGTAAEVDVAYNALTNTFSFGLPNTITASLDGNASSADAWSTARTLSLGGDLSGSVSIDGSQNVTLNATIQSGTALTFSDGTASEDIGLGDTISFVGTASEVDVAYDAASNTFTFSLPATINADLNGNATTASEAEILSTARTISISGDATGSASFNGSADADIALTIEAGAVENSMLVNDSIGISLDGVAQESVALGESLDFVAGQDIDLAYNATSNALTVSLEAVIDSDTTGNAATATQLATARTLSISGDATGSASFDGSANADIALTISAGAVDNAMLANSSISFSDGTATDVTALGESLNIVGTASEVEVALDAGSSTFTIGLPDTIAAELNGNAATATKLATARTLSVSGDATGSVSFDGSANADIALTIEAGAVDNAMLANDGISLLVDGVAQEDINLGDSLNIISGQDIDVTYNAASNALTVALEATIDSDTTGNAATASQLATARTLSVSGDAAGSVSFDGSANADIALTIQPSAVENSMLANSSITFSDGTASDVTALGESITIAGTASEIDVSLDAGTSTFTLSLPSTINADLNGNAATASEALILSNARTLSLSGDVAGSVSFDGSANVDIAATIQPSSVENSMLANSSISFSDGTATDITALGDSLNLEGTANEVTVSLDAGTSTFTFGLPATISADVNGNAATASEATILSTSRTISLTGDVAGSASFNGSADASITATIQPSSVENSMLANSGITVSDGTNGEAINLGEAFSIQGTAAEVEVAYSTLNNRFTVGLPDSVAIVGDLEVGDDLNVLSTLTVSGNATFNGNLVANTANVRFADTILELGVNNELSADHGFFSARAANSYTGIFFDETDDKWKLFTDTAKPGTTVDTAAGSFALADMQVKDFSATTLAVSGEYTLPSADGSNGQVLTTDGAGNVSFQTPSSGAVASALTVVTADHTITTGSETEQIVLVRVNSSTVTVDLPDAATAGSGYSLTIRNSSNPSTPTSVTVARQGTDVINVDATNGGLTTRSLGASTWQRYMSDGSGTWYVIEN